MTKQKLVLVGCGQEKNSGKNYPWKLYKNDYFDKKMTVAMLLGQPAILSAKYGYLPVTKRIEPYEEDMREKPKHERESWALQTANDIPDFYDEVIILAGKKYRNPLKSMIEESGKKVYSPFESDDIGGIGDQISWCKSVAESIVNNKYTAVQLEYELEHE